MLTNTTINLEREEKAVLLRALKAQLIPFEQRLGEKILDGHLGEKQLNLLEQVLSDSWETANRESDPQELLRQWDNSHGLFIFANVSESANVLAEIRQGQAQDLASGLSLVRQMKMLLN